MSEWMEKILDQSQIGFQNIARNHQLVRWAEESQFARQAVVRNVKLMECQPSTIQDAIINVAAVGLTLNPAHGYAYLVPESKKIGDQYEQHCQLRISFKGLYKIATDAGAIEWLAADVVKANDQFKANGKWALPDHEFDPFGERGKSIGVYCTAKLATGEYMTEFASWDEVMKAKKAAKTPRVWNEWEDEMAKKFIIKRASKQWPKTERSERLSHAIHVIDEYEGSDFEAVERVERTAAYLIEHIAAEDKDAVIEAYQELSDQEKSMLFTAKSKGGYLTMKEKELIRQWRFESYKENADEELEAGHESSGDDSD